MGKACQIGVTDGLKHAHWGPSILFPHSGTSKETNLLTSKVMRLARGHWASEGQSLDCRHRQGKQGGYAGWAGLKSVAVWPWGSYSNISEPPAQDHKDQLTVTWVHSALPTYMALGHQPNPSKAGKGEKSVCKTRKSGRKSHQEPAGFWPRGEERTRLNTR